MKPTATSPVVLLPGLYGTDVLYRPLIRALSPDTHVEVIEYPTGGARSYEDAVRRASERLSEWPRCHIVGWSFSGPVALRLARAHPERVRSVTLAATFVEAPLRSLRVVAPLMYPGLVGLARTIRRLPIWLGRRADDPKRRDKAELWRRVGSRTLAARARANSKVDARGDLAAVTQPMQYLAPREDRIVPRRNLQQIRAIRGDVEVVALDGDHFAPYDDPEACAAVIRAFVARAEGDVAT
ncbi:MAG: alpha/beta hydrolase [Planctomycetota bacterium]|nr:alpha/beta hydrolase [Planctomycetota bacterium]